jgi:PAS domain S-box-containing protein
MCRGNGEGRGSVMLEHLHTQGIQHFGSLIIDWDLREVTVRGNLVHLTATEYTLLTVLTEHPRRAFSSDYLMRVVTDSDWVGDSHALQTHISRLRAKLGESGTKPRQVVTVHGYGYRFVPEPQPELASPIGVDAVEPALGDTESSFFIMLVPGREIIWASPSIRRFLGWQSSDLEGMRVCHFIHTDDRFAVSVARAELQNGNDTSFMLRLRTQDGGHRSVTALARPVVGPDGSVVLILGEFRPVTGDSHGLGVAQHTIRLAPGGGG